MCAINGRVLVTLTPAGLIIPLSNEGTAGIAQTLMADIYVISASAYYAGLGCKQHSNDLTTHWCCILMSTIPNNDYLQSSTCTATKNAQAHTYLYRLFRYLRKKSFTFSIFLQPLWITFISLVSWLSIWNKQGSLTPKTRYYGHTMACP